MKNLVTVLVLLGITLPIYAKEYDPWVLTEVLQRVDKVKKQSRTPVLVFDIDDTLVVTRTRTHRIMRDFILEPEISRRFPLEAARVKRLAVYDYGYELPDSLKANGIRNETFISEANTFWKRGFFSNAYCADDGVIKGAPAYVREARSRGAVIVYLTGRPRPQMQSCTLENLEARSFPLEKAGHLMMHPGDETSVLAYKQQAFENIRRLGTVVAAFENEPENINAMAEAFPKATMVFIDSIHSTKPVTPFPGIAWIEDYRFF